MMKQRKRCSLAMSALPFEQHRKVWMCGWGRAFGSPKTGFRALLKQSVPKPAVWDNQNSGMLLCAQEKDQCRAMFQQVAARALQSINPLFLQIQYVWLTVVSAELRALLKSFLHVVYLSQLLRAAPLTPGMLLPCCSTAWFSASLLLLCYFH